MGKHDEHLEDKGLLMDCVEPGHAVLYGSSHTFVGFSFGICLEEGRYEESITSARCE